MSLGEDCRVLIPFYLIAVYKIVFVYRINCLLTAPSQCLHAPGAGISSCRIRPHAKPSGLGVVWHGQLPVIKQVETAGGSLVLPWRPRAGTVARRSCHLGAGPGAPLAAPVPGGALSVHPQCAAPVPPAPLGVGRQWAAWWVAGRWSRAGWDPQVTGSPPYLCPLLMEQWPRLAPEGSADDAPLPWSGTPASSCPGLSGQLVCLAASPDPWEQMMDGAGSVSPKEQGRSLCFLGSGFLRGCE